jgi:hypothetical protein
MNNNIIIIRSLQSYSNILTADLLSSLSFQIEKDIKNVLTNSFSEENILDDLDAITSGTF